MTNARLIVWIVLCGLSTITALAQKPSQIELGFKADGLYQFSSLDSVNLFNGNLIVQIPIGATYGVDGGFKYGLTLVYNSKVWDYDQTPYLDDTYRTAYPNWRSNAGVGWRLSMGRLVAPQESTAIGQRWTYEDPSGSEHLFVESYEEHPPTSGVLYSVGQNRLRLVTPSADTPGAYPNTASEPLKYTKDQIRRVEFPNGEVHTFAKDCDAWRLREMKDAFGNYLRITPQCDANQRVVTWELVDSIGRRHSVAFRHFQATEHSIDRGQHVAAISLSTVAGVLHYSFDYANDGAATVDWGCGHDPHDEMGIGDTASLPLLERILLPDGTAFQFQYYRTEGQGGFCAQGAMQSLTVPTGGKFEYTYQQMRLPEDFCYVPQFPTWNPGVRTRKTPDGQWDYLSTLSKAVAKPPGFSADEYCGAMWANPAPNEMRTPGVDDIRRWARMTVLAPPALSGAGTAKTRQRTDSFFYAWTEAPAPVSDAFNSIHPTTLAKRVRYGQAITTGALPAPDQGPLPAAAWPYATEADADARVGVGASPEVSDIHYLSTRVYDGCADETGSTVTGTCLNGRLLRSTYQRLPFAEERTGSPQWTYPAESSRTIHHDGPTCGGEACWVQVSATDPDGYGHYKTSTTRSNFSGSPVVEFKATTNYLKYVAGNPWLLNLYDQTTREENGKKVVTDYSFNRTNGFLEAVRTRRDPSALSENDVLNVFTGSRGNVEREETYGGDRCDGAGNCVSGLSVATPFSKGNAPRQYLTKHTFSRGVLAKSEVCDPASANDGCTSLLTTVDLDIHSSGMPTASRDAAGVKTSYDYDEFGRLETVTAPGPTVTTYVYNAPTTTSNMKVRETVTDGTSMQLSEATYEFDGLGRVHKITKSLPDQKTATVTTTYDSLGRKWLVTQPRAAGDLESTSTETRYDALGRPVWIKAPDEKVTTVTYGGERTVARTASVATTESGEDSVVVTEHYDAQRRLTKVEEFSGNTSAQQPKGSLTATVYKYDVAGRLVEVKNGTQEARTFTYDGRGFLIEESHPEGGTTTYGLYDSRGHARRKTNGTTLTMEYDAAERLTHIRSGSIVLKRFDYATTNDTSNPSNLTAGKLVASVRRNEVSAGVFEVTESYEYTHTGGLLSKRKTKVEHVNGSARTPVQTFEQKVEEYDAFRLPKTMSLPDCLLHGCVTTSGLGSITFDRDAGYLASVRGFASLNYASSGMVRSVVHQLTPEKTETDTYTPDAGMARPSNIKLAGSACPLPTPSIRSAATICPGTSGTGSVTRVDGTSYLWSIQGGSLTSPANGADVTFTAGAGSSSVTLSVTATNACGTGSQTKVIAASTVLAPPVITAPAAACANSSVTASVPANPDLTYVWTMSPGSWSATGAKVTFTAPGAAFTLTVTATNSCGGSASASKTIGIEAPASARLYLRNPNLPYQPEAFRVRGSGETVTLKVEFPDVTGPWEVLWKDGLREIATTNPHERIVMPETNSEYRLDAVTPQRCGEPSGIIYVRVLPPAPAAVTATTQLDGKVYLTWSAVPAAGSYSIERKASTTGALEVLAEASGDATSLLYTPPPPPPTGPAPQVHFYYVRTVDLDGADKSHAQAFDHAITGTSPAAGTFIESQDIQRLRAAIDAYRLAFQLPAAYTAAPAPDGVIAAADVSDLVLKLNQARGSNPFFYRDVPPPARDGFFYRDHLQQLWEALR